MIPETAAGIPSWEGANVAFWTLTMFVLISSAVAAFARRIVNAAFGLFFALLAMAGYYVLLGSGFLAITQVVVYVGGILVLLMFGILLTNAPVLTDMKTSLFPKEVAAVAALMLFLLFGLIILNIPWTVTPMAGDPPGEIHALGEQLLTTYAVPFEAAGIMLLFCLVGAAYLVRGES